MSTVFYERVGRASFWTFTTLGALDALAYVCGKVWALL